jgi:hypothetical protein
LQVFQIFALLFGVLAFNLKDGSLVYMEIILLVSFFVLCTFTVTTQIVKTVVQVQSDLSQESTNAIQIEESGKVVVSEKWTSNFEDTTFEANPMRRRTTLQNPKPVFRIQSSILKT